ncbi:MAG: CDP-glycerol glycerophosphotransferase family protein [Clostridia bacterium]|nr:CDP-glycerol glycerophosphotransferase family protein [Clostridia bacterium]
MGNQLKGLVGSGPSKLKGKQKIEHQLKKLPLYLKNVFLLAALWPVATVLRKTNKTYRGLWLVSERGIDARDNGYWFFRYLREKQPQVNTCFVIDKSSPDYEKVARLGNTVAYRSLRHYLMYLAADQLISTHVQPASPDLMTYYHLRQIGIHPRGKQVFLQHGIIMNEMKWMRYPQLKLDFFASGGKMEYDYLAGEFGFPEGVVQYTGLCRYDNLMRGNHPSNEILVMPTWRSSNYPMGEQFYETPFYQYYQSLLNHPRLLKLLEERDLKLLFYPHIELQKELDKFKSPSERIILASWREYDVQTLMMRCNMMITDYSSVHFDVGYMEKPIIYYQFDYEDFRKFSYQEGYFSCEKHGFGPVVKTEEALMEALIACARNDFRMEKKYHDRLDAFFQMRDEKNCERTYQALCRLMKKQ